MSLDEWVVEGAAVPIYDPLSLQSAERVLLAGDAVGGDPWFGEGISVAIGTGMLAAHSAAHAIESNDFCFSDYTGRVRKSAVGWQLRRNRAAAHRFYRDALEGRSLGRWLGSSGVSA